MTVPQLVPARHSSDGRGQGPAAAGPAGPALPRQRRRSMLLIGIALICAGGVASFALVTSASHRVPVVVAARDIPVGSVITSADLATADVSAGAGVASIPGRQEFQVAGQRAAVDVRAGTLLVPADITSAAVPAPGQALVSVPLQAWQIPASGLAPGTPVRIIPTPGAAGQAAGGQAGQALTGDPAATVYRVSALDQSGHVVVDLLVPVADMAAVAKQASTGQIALAETARGS